MSNQKLKPIFIQNKFIWAFPARIGLGDTLKKSNSLLWTNNNFGTSYIFQESLEIHKTYLNIKKSKKFYKRYQFNIAYHNIPQNYYKFLILASYFLTSAEISLPRIYFGKYMLYSNIHYWNKNEPPVERMSDSLAFEVRYNELW